MAKKILACFCALLLCFITAESAIAETKIPVKKEPKDDETISMPHAPARSIIYGVLSDDVLTLYSRQDGEASINIVDSTGTVIADGVTDLTCGYAVFIGDAEGAVYVSVVFNSETYTVTL